MLNGASDLMCQLFPDQPLHARSAIGTPVGSLCPWSQQARISPRVLPRLLRALIRTREERPRHVGAEVREAGLTLAPPSTCLQSPISPVSDPPGTNTLPLGIAVEVEAIVKVRPL